MRAARDETPPALARYGRPRSRVAPSRYRPHGRGTEAHTPSFSRRTAPGRVVAGSERDPEPARSVRGEHVPQESPGAKRTGDLRDAGSWLRAALLARWIVVVELAEDRAPPPAPPAPPAPPPPDPPAPIEIEFTYSLQLVDEIGAPLSGFGVGLEVDGKSTPRVTDEAGFVGGKGNNSSATARIANPLGLRAELRSRWKESREKQIPTTSGTDATVRFNVFSVPRQSGSSARAPH